MQAEEFFYNCSRQYIWSVDPGLRDEVLDIVKFLPKREKQEDINRDYHWLLVNDGWSYDSNPAGLPVQPPIDLGIESTPDPTENDRTLCLSSTTLDAGWHSDFAKSYEDKLVQIEVQFGKVELMFKDFCGFAIAYHERRLALGIEIVLCSPREYFSHRKESISGMAYFDIAKETLPAIGLDCPIWLIGMK